MSSTEDIVSRVLAAAHPKLRERCSKEKILLVLEGNYAAYDADTLRSLALLERHNSMVLPRSLVSMQRRR